MTFTEAAAQVLRLVGKPLHYKEITDVAIEKNLLSHVGKSPEVTMGARLAALVKKTDRDNPLVRVKPGVFALRDWDNDTIAKGLADRTPALERLAAAMAAAGEVLVDVDTTEEVAVAIVEATEEPAAPAEVVIVGNEDDRRRAELAAGANELFSPEDDDDKPIFGAAEEEEEEDEEGGDRGDRRRRRGRRSKRGRNGEEIVRGGDDLPGYTVSEPSTELLKVADAELRAREGRQGREPRGFEAPRDSRDNRGNEAPRDNRSDSRVDSRNEGRDRSDPRGDARGDRDLRDSRGDSRERDNRDNRADLRDRGDIRDRGDLRDRGDIRDRGDLRDRGDIRDRDNRGDLRDRGEREYRVDVRDRDTRVDTRDNRDRDNRDLRDNRGELRDRDSREREVISGGSLVRDARAQTQTPIDDLVGRDLADALAILLSTYDRNGGPIGFARLAETAKRRGRLQADIPQGQALLEAAARADNLRRQSTGQRPRFRIGDRRVALTDWATDIELQRIERDLYAVVERYKEQAKRSLLRRIQELPQRSFGELVLLLLERVGFAELSPVRRPGTHGAELHLTGRLLGPSGEMRTAVVLRRDGREIGRERVTELRGALHHYGPANAGWLITAGQVLSGAKEEANAVGAAPVHLVDGMGLVRLMEDHAIGTSRVTLNLPVADIELLDALKSGG
jgi:restriction endonuclease Mrr